MSGDTFMASLLSENSSEPVAQEVPHVSTEKESTNGTLSFQGSVTVEPQETTNSMSEINVNGVSENGLNLGSNDNDSSIGRTKSLLENNPCSEIKELVDDVVDSAATDFKLEEKTNVNIPGEGEINNKDRAVKDTNDNSNAVEDKSDEKSNMIEAAENKNDATSNMSEAAKLSIENVALLNEENNIPMSCSNGDLTSESKMHLETEDSTTQKYRNESVSSDDTSSTFDLGSSSECSDTFLDKMHKNTTTNKIINVKTKGELDLDELPPIEDLTITVTESEMQKVGTIYAIVDKLVIVRALKDLQPLDIDSVLFLSNANPLGRIFDVFGPVVEPFYSIRFNSPQHIADKCIANDADVFFAPQKKDITTYVFVDQLRKQKGSDASWQDNNEPPEEHLDYSDDEEEKAAIRKRRAKNRARSVEDEDVQIIPHKINNSGKDPLSPWILKESPSQKSSTSLRYRTKPASQNPFFAAQPSSRSGLNNSFTSTLPLPTSQPFLFQARPTAYVTNRMPPQSQMHSFASRPQQFMVQSSVSPAPVMPSFQGGRTAYVPNRMPPQSPMHSFASRPQQFMVQPSVSPAPVMPPFQGGPIFGQLVMSPPPVQNQFMGQQQVLSYNYPPFRPTTFGSQVPNFSQATTFSSPVTSSANQNKNFVSQASNFVNQAPVFVSQAGNFVNHSVPMLVQTPMGPQFQQMQSMGPPPAMRIAPLSVNIPSQSPHAIHPFIQQSPGLLNVMPPTGQQDFSHNRY